MNAHLNRYLSFGVLYTDRRRDEGLASSIYVLDKGADASFVVKGLRGLGLLSSIGKNNL